MIQMIQGKGSELRESMLRTILLLGGLATIVASTQCFFVMELDKSMVLVENAGHGMSYYVDMEKVNEGVLTFLDKIMKDV